MPFKKTNNNDDESFSVPPPQDETTRQNSAFTNFLPFFLFAAVPLGQYVYHHSQESDGVRTGALVKFSNKGRINKSWEGEMMLGGAQSGQTWTFSLEPGAPQEAALARALQEAQTQNRPVALTYRQHFTLPWKVDTIYIVDKVESAKN